MNNNSLSILCYKEPQKLLSGEEEKDLGQRIQTAKEKESIDQEAVDLLVHHNLKLVYFYVQRYHNNHSYLSHFDDLIEEGMIGLIKAAHNFDPSKAKFSTYAFFWVRQQFDRYLYRGITKITQLPENVVSKTIEVLSYARERDLTFRQACHTLYPRRILDLEHALSILESKQSLDNPLHLDPTFSLKELLPAPLVQDTKPLLEELEYLCSQSNLSVREKEVLFKRYGIYGTPLTLDKIGKELGLSRERVRQIENKALRKISSEVKVTQREFPLERRIA